MGSRNVIVVAGVSGTGKSIFGRRLMLNDRSLKLRFMFDAEFSERDNTKTEFCDFLGLSPCRDGHDMLAAIPTGYIPFDPHALYAGRLEEAVETFCGFACDVSMSVPGEKLIVIPEVWRYCRPQSIPKSLANIVQSGRRIGLRLLVDTQEPNKLNSSILNGASEAVCFKLQGDLAVDEMKKSFGFDADEVKALQKFELIGRNMDTGGVRRGKLKL